MNNSISRRIAEELAVREAQVEAAIGLLDEGSTVPFIARYRKEVTGALDDTQLRQLEERLHYLREMEERRTSILASIEEQGKLTPELKTALLAADSKQRLEDLYLPYKQKRRTKAQIAREAGLEPLALGLLQDPTQDPETLAGQFLNPDAGIEDAKAALDGARQILMENFAEDADLLARLRSFLAENALLAARVTEGMENDGAKFRDYFEHTEALSGVPSHRALAMFRGRREGVLNLSLVMHAEESPTETHPCEAMVAQHVGIEDCGRAADGWLRDTVRWTWRVKLLTHLQTDLLGTLREQAEEEAIRVFASNLKDLLLAAPAGHKATIGLDPGLRTGVKVAVIDATGKVLDHGAIFPNPPQKKVQEAEAVLLKMIREHGVELIAIGNGTASRETDRFVGDLLKAHPELNCRKVMVNEAGASVYSASEFAAKEFPDLDVTIRGAISIARRLQDPLAELVKIEPKSIGVGQYQHDVSQVQLARQLDAVVEDCVNAVGVDVNTASAPLLARVSGLSQSIAGNIVALRDEQGRFADRQALLKVSRFGDKTFEQAAGFLRIQGGDNPLDASSVHPESYGVVQNIAARQGREVSSLVGDGKFLRGLDPADYTSESVGLPTVKDIIAELEKPGRDPRPEFKMASFADGVEKISDLRPDMVLEGTVTNVTNFGAFVDIGVHQDGLVHISALSEKFVKDPREVVKAGDIVKVKVMEVDEPRKRIGLSMRLSDSAGEEGAQRGSRRGGERGEGGRRDGGSRSGGKPPRQPKRQDSNPPANNAFAAAFANARKGR
ncbi:RNA-binding transcriptional accessory protein [Mangrovimicrobium sediminis]|uniref:RNA-binding transcriptional accessory protein n=1 Tax=Mangrovimicrobium sediminis TaxID=2562682 RepID=A0A4Z0M8L4_9GAMM|nr:Tex family protein [Haliea sp. SAOS-164]TGD75717.1 RNA-binding transcriptional accessory protein [Haliea sp. SAOS-164]